MTKKEALIKKAEELAARKLALEQENLSLEHEIIAMQEEKQKLHDDTRARIEEVCKGKYFCGVVLNSDQIAAIVKLAIETRESVSIEFQLYPQEDVQIEETDTKSETAETEEMPNDFNSIVQ